MGHHSINYFRDDAKPSELVREELVTFITNLRSVGNSSAPRQSMALKPMVETAPKMQDRIRLDVCDDTR